MADPFAGVPAATEMGGAAYRVVPNSHAQPSDEAQTPYAEGFVLSALGYGQTGAAVNESVAMKEGPVGPFSVPDTTGSSPDADAGPVKANRKNVLAKPAK